MDNYLKNDKCTFWQSHYTCVIRSCVSNNYTFCRSWRDLSATWTINAIVVCSIEIWPCQKRVLLFSIFIEINIYTRKYSSSFEWLEDFLSQFDCSNQICHHQIDLACDMLLLLEFNFAMSIVKFLHFSNWEYFRFQANYHR